MLKNPLYLGQIAHAGEHYEGQHERIIERDVFNEVQATLAEHGPGETAKSKRASPALLKGFVFDASGNRLQPTHCIKKGTRYHYYTSAKRLRDAKEDPTGIRAPAGDLEGIVANGIAAWLKDRPLLQHSFASRVQLIEVPHLLGAAAGLAEAIAGSEPSKRKIIRLIIIRITVSRTAIRIIFSDHGLRQSLGVSGNHMDVAHAVLPHDGYDREARIIDRQDSEAHDGRAATPLDVTISSHMLRCGKQMKFVLGTDNKKQPDPNPKLVDMILQTRRWFTDLSSGTRSSIGDIAKNSSYDRTYISRLITLAFLAPDIVERIVTGDHSPTLTPV